MLRAQTPAPDLNLDFAAFSPDCCFRDTLMPESKGDGAAPSSLGPPSIVAKRKPKPSNREGRTSLKILADYLGLCPATVSVVLNNVPGRSIPHETRERVREAARKFNYQPSLLARSLRKKRTFTVGILVPELNDGYHTMVMSGIGDHLMREGYFYFNAHHRHKPDMIEEYPRLLIGRGAEGLITIDTNLEHELSIPVVAVAGHKKISGITNVLLDHRRAAELVLRHLVELGHKHVAFMRGQPFSADSLTRWQNIVAVAKELGLSIDPDLTVQLERDISSPELGYPVVQTLLQSRKRFTAIVAFNDMSAIGAIRALQDANLAVPEDVSVIGFDDIQLAAYHTPRLTTIRQPLRDMGETAARILLQRLQGFRDYPMEFAVPPELIIRETTAAANPKRRLQGT
jgi:LacI family transcriptional regulator, galactose operon repressor